MAAKCQPPALAHATQVARSPPAQPAARSVPHSPPCHASSRNFLTKWVDCLKLPPPGCAQPVKLCPHTALRFQSPTRASQHSLSNSEGIVSQSTSSPSP